jgi:uncharacterized protein (TIGR02118 family)
MARMIAIYKAPKDEAAFQRHYFETHIPLAKKLPGLRKYEVSHGPIVTAAGGSGVSFVAILHFEDMAAIRRAFASAEGQACAADRRLLAPGGDDVQILLFDSREV